MKYFLSLYLFLNFLFINGQNYQIFKTVVDLETKLPLENVLVFNNENSSISNIDGKFIFISQKNEINLNLLGYEVINTTFDELKITKDTIFMQSKAIQLNEVFVTNSRAYMQNVYSNFKNNLLSNYTVNFFLRNILKKDNENIVLQDFFAKKNENTANKTVTTIEILNMRKIKISDRKDHVDFKFNDFNELYRMDAPGLDNCNFTEVSFNDINFKKVLFESIEKDSSGQIWSGYFIINRNDYAVVEYNQTWISDPDKVPYQKFKFSDTRYRTVKGIKSMKLTKDIALNKYYPSNIKIEYQVEVINDKKTFFYDNNMDYFVTNNPSNEKVNSNFDTDKDIFKAKFPYSKDFWKNQNQLPLTQELEQFLKSVSEKKDKTKEYEVIGDF